LSASITADSVLTLFDPQQSFSEILMPGGAFEPASGEISDGLVGLVERIA
jgi:hypothetical protein